jgi:hypothetical protein
MLPPIPVPRAFEIAYFWEVTSVKTRNRECCLPRPHNIPVFAAVKETELFEFEIQNFSGSLVEVTYASGAQTIPLPPYATRTFLFDSSMDVAFSAHYPDDVGPVRRFGRVVIRRLSMMGLGTQGAPA